MYVLLVMGFDCLNLPAETSAKMKKVTKNIPKIFILFVNDSYNVGIYS